MTEESQDLIDYTNKLSNTKYNYYFVPLVKNYYQESHGCILTINSRYTQNKPHLLRDNNSFYYNTCDAENLFYFNPRCFDFIDCKRRMYCFFYEQLPTNCGIAFFYGLHFMNGYYNSILKFIEDLSRDLGFSQLLFTHALTKEQKKIVTDYGFSCVFETRNRRSYNTIQTFSKEILK